MFLHTFSIVPYLKAVGFHMLDENQDACNSFEYAEKQGRLNSCNSDLFSKVLSQC